MNKQGNVSNLRTQSDKDQEVGERTALLPALDDKRSLQLIKQAHREWLAALDAIQDPIFIHDSEFRVLRSNRAYADYAGMSVKEVIGKPYYEMFPRHNGPLPECRELAQNGGVTEAEISPGDGKVYLSRAVAVMDGDGNYVYSLHIMYDITERKRLEARLHASETNYRLLFESSRDALTTVLPPLWKFANANAAALKLFGAESEAEFITLGPWDVSPERQPDGMLSSEKARQVIQQAMQEGSLLFEWLHKRRDGTEFLAEVLLTRVERGGEVFLQATSRDITERKRSEENLLRLNRALKTLSECNQTLIFAEDEMQLLRDMCWVIVETGGFQGAWVGYAQNDAQKTIRPMAQHGFDEGELGMLSLTWDKDNAHQCLAGRAVSSGRTQIVQDIAHDSCFDGWRKRARQLNIGCAIAFPLNEGKAVFGSLDIYAQGVGAIKEAEVRLLQELANDLAFGIGTMRLRREREQGIRELRNALEGTVQAVSGMVEMRDPYTAGHERRVAELASAIGIEMGLSNDRVHGMQLAGEIHDLGKIQVPAEILSKPGRVTETEFGLIKVHPQTGYEILKNIEFPWPVAQMVLQHHERIDGSGYPQGLKGDTILLEARILGVADVVEAMASHRPYRPGLGLPAALEEIRKNSGRLYDPEVVKACIEVFEKNKFSLPETWLNHR
jgi:PAS domain S-box-containing protein